MSRGRGTKQRRQRKQPPTHTPPRPTQGVVERILAALTGSRAVQEQDRADR